MSKKEKQPSLIELIESFQNGLELTEFSFHSIQLTGINSKLLAELLTVDETTAVLYAGLFYLSISRSSMDFDDLVNNLGISKKDFRWVYECLLKLKAKRLIFFERNQGFIHPSNQFQFSIPRTVFNQILKGEKLTFQVKKPTDVYQVIVRCRELVEFMDETDMSDDEFFREFDELLASASSLPQIKWLESQVRDPFEKVLLLLTAESWLNLSGAFCPEEVLDKLFSESKHERIRIKHTIQRGELFIQKKEFVKLTKSFYKDGIDLELTETVTDSWFPEEVQLTPGQFPKPKFGSWLDGAKIVEMPLHFNSGFEGQVSQVKQALDEQNYSRIKQRFEEKGLRRGMAMIFHGAPGTGKTEFVYQLARQTGRAILHVNISEIRDAWVGESEKNLASIFSHYKKLRKMQERDPILLFNESDALIGNRIEVKGSVDQMNNAMQNILLESLEKFEGILIATTNLIENIDPAFDRRFLFKLEFSLPDLTTRKKIWLTKMPGLSEENALILAEYKDLTGAQIENVVRKADIETILHGKEPDLNCLLQLSREEILRNAKKKGIGF